MKTAILLSVLVFNSAMRVNAQNLSLNAPIPPELKDVFGPSEDAVKESPAMFRSASVPDFAGQKPDAPKQRVRFASLPLVFEPNVGQAAPEVRYLGRGAGYTLLLTSRDAVLQETGQPPVRLRLAGDKAAKTIEASDPTGGVSNYLIGSDPSKWRRNVPHYRRIRYRDVYPGIDQVFYGDAGRLEYDLVVSPGADPSQITMEFDGGAMRLDKVGDLVLGTGTDEVRLRRPTVYQTDPRGKRVIVDATFRLEDRHRASFTLARHDASRELVIDPVVEYASYLGGSSYDQGKAIVVDTAGNAYVAGSTGSTNFPTVNPISNTGYGGGTYDAVITKINPSGTAILYSTYLGGSATDQANAVALDPAGNAYLTGSTHSSDFPVQNPVQFQNKSPFYGTAFVAKLTPSGQLVYSTYLGGTAPIAPGDTGSGIGADAAGNAYIAGTTYSADFPTKNPLQSPNGAASMFVTKLSPDGSTLVYSTVYGGQSTVGYGIAVDNSGNAYAVGQAYFINGFPTLHAITPATNQDIFVLKLTPTGTIGYSTIIAPGVSAAIALDGSGNAYIVGMPIGLATFPLVKPLYSSTQQASNFVAKLNAAGTALVYSTFFPGCTFSSVATDAAGNAYLTGTANHPSNTSTFPLTNPFQTTGSSVIVALNPDASALLYSTFLGSQGTAYGIASDAAGDVYVTGMGLGMPPDSTAFQPNPNSYPDAFVFAYSASAAPVVATVNAASFAVGVPAAPSAIVAGFGSHLATQTVSASGTLGTTLGGTTVQITDAHSVTTPAEIFFASAGQVNFLIPPSVALGAGQVQITAGDGTPSVGPITITAIAPGIFTADGTVAVGQAVQVDAQGNQTALNLADYNAATGKFSAAPISLTPGTSTILVLYGTGIRNAPLSEVTMQIGGQTVTPAFAGIQGTFAGLDQINVQIPQSLAGSGDTAITLSAGGITSNGVHVAIQ